MLSLHEYITRRVRTFFVSSMWIVAKQLEHIDHSLELKQMLQCKHDWHINNVNVPIWSDKPRVKLFDFWPVILGVFQLSDRSLISRSSHPHATSSHNHKVSDVHRWDSKKKSWVKSRGLSRFLGSESRGNRICYQWLIVIALVLMGKGHAWEKLRALPATLLYPLWHEFVLWLSCTFEAMYCTYHSRWAT